MQNWYLVEFCVIAQYSGIEAETFAELHVLVKEAARVKDAVGEVGSSKSEKEE